MPGRFILIKTYTFAHEADMELMLLKNAGIPAYIQDAHAVNTLPHNSIAIGGVKIFVNDNHVDEAVKLLSPSLNDEKVIDQEFGPYKTEPVSVCPECKSPNIFSGGSFFVGLLIFITATLPFSTSTRKRYCADCGCKWTTD